MDKLDKLTTLRQRHPNVVKRYSTFSIANVAAELRTGKLRDDTYHIVDIIAMAPDLVIQGNEFVPGSIHAGALTTCMNRPVVLDHPLDGDGVPISANTPNILEAIQFGHVFEPYYDDVKGLVLPSWLSDDLANLVGDEAVSVISDFSKGVSREISIGAYTYIEEVEGGGVAPDGTPYRFIWIDYDLDHLAVLSGGDIGACGNSAGCGPDFNKETTLNMNKWKQTALRAQAQIARALPVTFTGAILNGELSTAELHEKLSVALSKDEGTAWDFYGWFKGVYVEAQAIDYTVRDAETGDMIIWHREYTLDDGVVILADTKTEVEGFTAVLKGSDDTSPSTSTITNEGVEMQVTTEVKRLVGMIVACEKCPPYLKNEDYLSTLSEEDLESILAKDDTSSSTEKDKLVGEQDDDDVVQVSRADFEAMRSTIDEMGSTIDDQAPAAAAWNSAQQAKKDGLITSIAAAKPSMSKDVYSKWDLAKLTAYHKDLGLDAPLTPNFGLLSTTDTSSAPRPKSLRTHLTTN